MEYKTIIGLEIHAELLTKSKVFCNCTTQFGGEPNTHCCPICLGLPGALPVVNKKAVEFGIKTGLALNCNISKITKMSRKNYFYPDLVKGYQISQYDMPLCKGGYLEIDVNRNTEKRTKRIRLKRIHIEEDTGKSIHSMVGDTLLDYNRSGVPLLEIVTEPDINSSEEVKSFLEMLKSILQYIEVSDCKMEEGSLRCDVNINVVNIKNGQSTAMTELKNLNSFKSVVKAIEYEEQRHRRLLEEGKKTRQETRRWDEKENKTVLMRVKENVEDYRYFPEPDIVELKISKEWIEKVSEQLPELPDDKKKRFIKQYNLPEYDAQILTSRRELADFFEKTASYAKDSKQISNWIIGDILRILKDNSIQIKDLKIKPRDLGELILFINEGKISNNIGKKVLEIMVETGKSPSTIINERGLTQISDRNRLKKIVSKVLDRNQQSVEDYKNGKTKAFGFLVGQVMRETKGKANPRIVNQILNEILDE